MDATRSLSVAVVVLGALAPGVWAGKAPQIRKEAIELLDQGVSAYNRGSYAEAVEKLRRCAAVALSSFRAHYYLGLALSGDRRYAEAVDALSVAHDLDPDHHDGLIALGDAYLKQGDVEEAQVAYFSVLKKQPDYPPALDAVGRSYESLAEDQKAIDYFRRAMASNRGFAPAYSHLGQLYMRQDRLQEAVALLEEAISVWPDYAHGLNRLALGYGRLGLHNEAAALIQRAIELEPRNGAHQATLGHLQLQQGLLHAAEASFKEALQSDPAMPDARQGLAEVARRHGEYASALEHLDAALQDARIDPTTAGRLQQARAAIVAEQTQLAELESRAQQGNAAPEELSRLSAIYGRRGLWERAVDYQEQAASSPEQRERLAYAFIQAGRFREGQRLYAELARERDRAPLHLNLGISLAMLGDDAAAIEAYRRALELQPDLAAARVYTANALLRLGRTPEAAQTYKAYLDAAPAGEAAERVRRILRQIAPELVVQATPAVPARAPGDLPEQKVPSQ
jgi:tetratricopeptide (TPR) repeat protein